MTGARGLLLGVAAALLMGCGESTRPSVLLVTIDTLRADVLAPWGGPADVAPRLSELAAQGTRFAACSTVTPLTLPAHASLLTGLRPAHHGLTVNGVSRPALPAPTLAQRLREQGYATAAFVSSLVLDHRHGLDAGFDRYDDDLHGPGAPAMPTERDGALTVTRASSWIAERSGPWFAWVHLYDPHAPYAAPGGATEPAREAYLDEVAYADRQLGRLLDALPSEGEILIVVTSDHGEGLGDHGEATHGLLLFESTLHVPLVMARRGVPTADFPRAGELRSEPVSLLDVTPTLATLLELPPWPDLDGVPLLEPSLDRPLPLESRSPLYYYGFSPLAGVRRGALKLIAAPRASPPGLVLYDLGQDPSERAGESVDKHRLVRDLPDTRPRGEAVAVTSDDALAQLGYLGARVPTESDGVLRDPRTALELVEGIDAANTALVLGDPLTALARLTPLRDEFGDVAELQLFLGKSYRALGRHELAVGALARAAALQPGSTGILTEQAKALLERDDAQGGTGDDARAVLEQALRLTPNDPDAIALLALVEVVFGDPAQALALLGPALLERPRATNLLQVKARALERLGRHAEAASLRATLPGDG